MNRRTGDLLIPESSGENGRDGERGSDTGLRGSVVVLVDVNDGTGETVSKLTQPIDKLIVQHSRVGKDRRVVDASSFANSFLPGEIQENS